VELTSTVKDAAGNPHTLVITPFVVMVAAVKLTALTVATGSTTAVLTFDREVQLGATPLALHPDLAAAPPTKHAVTPHTWTTVLSRNPGVEAKSFEVGVQGDGMFKAKATGLPLRQQDATETASVSFDTTAPTIAGVTSAPSRLTGNGQEATVTITFSEEVDNWCDLNKIQVIGGKVSTDWVRGNDRKSGTLKVTTDTGGVYSVTFPPGTFRDLAQNLSAGNVTFGLGSGHVSLISMTMLPLPSLPINSHWKWQEIKVGVSLFRVFKLIDGLAQGSAYLAIVVRDGNGWKDPMVYETGWNGGGKAMIGLINNARVAKKSGNIYTLYMDTSNQSAKVWKFITCEFDASTNVKIGGLGLADPGVAFSVAHEQQISFWKIESCRFSVSHSATPGNGTGLPFNRVPGGHPSHHTSWTTRDLTFNGLVQVPRNHAMGIDVSPDGKYIALPVLPSKNDKIGGVCTHPLVMVWMADHWIYIRPEIPTEWTVTTTRDLDKIIRVKFVVVAGVTWLYMLSYFCSVYRCKISIHGPEGMELLYSEPTKAAYSAFWSRAFAVSSDGNRIVFLRHLSNFFLIDLYRKDGKFESNISPAITYNDGYRINQIIFDEQNRLTIYSADGEGNNVFNSRVQ
jgi:hypothetical protein